MRIVRQRRKDIEHINDKFWTVKSESSSFDGVSRHVYAINWNAQTCSCEDFKKHEDRCKHLWAVHYTKQIGWGSLSFSQRQKIGWYQTNLTIVAGKQYSSPTPSKCLTHVEYYRLEAAFIEIERRIEALGRIGNHHARQLAKWLGKWSQRINFELSRRPIRRVVYTEIL